jgi:hypothetical protein
MINVKTNKPKINYHESTKERKYESVDFLTSLNQVKVHGSPQTNYFFLMTFACPARAGRWKRAGEGGSFGIWH